MARQGSWLMRATRRQLQRVWLVFSRNPRLPRRWESRHIATTWNTTPSRSSPTDSNKPLKGSPSNRALCPRLQSLCTSICWDMMVDDKPWFEGGFMGLSIMEASSRLSMDSPDCCEFRINRCEVMLLTQACEELVEIRRIR